jgi:phosphatidylethanolamine/phosphatidyl-N-methylethanolamine N-methyltransferase
MAFHVVSVVPDPIRMIEEVKRVCRPGGKIVIVNHFTSEVPVLGHLTEAMDPVTRRLGWRTNLRLEPFVRESQLKIDRVYKISKLSLYTVLVSRNEKKRYSEADSGKGRFHPMDPPARELEKP